MTRLRSNQPECAPRRAPADCFFFGHRERDASAYYCLTTGATLPSAWMSTISFRGHLVTQVPQEVHLSYASGPRK